MTKNDLKYKIIIGGFMFSKQNNRIIVDTKKAIVIITCLSIFCTFLIILAIVNGLNKKTYASTIPENKENNSNIESDIDILGILEQNTKTKCIEEFTVEEATLEYTTIYQDDITLPKGMIKVLQEGRDGLEQQTIKKTFIDGELKSEEKTETKIMKPAINKIVAVGTSSYTSNYKIKVGDILYATPDTLGIMSEPNQNAEKLLTISEESEVRLLGIEKEWYKICYHDTYIGYAPGNCFTYLQPKTLVENNNGTEQSYTKEQLLANLSFNMKLDKPSGLTLEQFRKVLSYNEKDTNKIFENNADYFYYIEKQYHINGIFVAALGIHESGWGTSKICLNKKNIFGYGAYDRDPYNSAYSYQNYSESIDLIARVLVKYYLNPSGTSIYDGQVASGTYYNGPTLTGVNTKYATDKNWGNAIYHWMKFLYNNL